MTRDAVLAAARRQFAAHGYDAATIRAIAAEAEVDPGVVMHFFGSKRELFRSAVGWPFDPATLPARLAASSRAESGARLAELFFGIWDDPATRASLTAIMRSAMLDESAAALLREYLIRHLLAAPDGSEATLRANLAASHLIGVAMLRYVLRVEPIASLGTDALVEWIAPALTRYLSGVTPFAPEAHSASGEAGGKNHGAK